MKLKKISFIGLLTVTLSITGTILNIKATDENKSQIHGPEVTDYFTIIDENGASKIVYFDDIENDDSIAKEMATEYNLVAGKGDDKEVVATYDSKEDAQQALNKRKYLRSSTTYSVEEKNKAVTYGVVYLNAKSYDGKSYLTYDNVSNPGYDGYTTGSYAKDAAYLGTFNGKVRAMQAGVIMDFDSRDVTVIDYSAANISYYYVSDGYLYHRFYYGSSNKYNTYRVGYKLSYLSAGTKYYSYDGHYFYTSYPNMIKDYQNGVHTNAVNKSDPYYNYYQYLSHRTTTSLSAGQINSIVNDHVGSSSSKMKNMGSYFIQYQNAYGVNGLLMLGVSGNESTWGTSDIAKDKNNLFGHGAVDSNPYYGAHGYATASDSIKYHAEKFISNGYLDNEDWRYNGGYLGDKAGGINVRYASDPYWGEKAASVNYYYGVGNDYGRYTMGIINGVQKSYKLYKEASYSSPVIHTLGQKTNGVTSPRTYNLAVVILDTVTDSAGNRWYKIQSDTALNSSRTDTDWDGIYNFSKDYYFIPTSNVTVINQGNVKVPSYYTGDVNGDGKVSSLDYIQIKNHIMKTKVLSGDALLRADVNGDGKVSSLDYIKIKNHIMGTNRLF